MNQNDAFEMDFTAAMRSYAEEAPTQIDAVALVRSLAATRALAPRRLIPAGAARSYRWLLLAGLLAVALATALAIGFGNRPAVVVVPSPTVSPSVAPASGALAFIRGGDVWMLSEGESEPALVVEDLAVPTAFLNNERWLHWSPDGATLAMAKTTPQGEDGGFELSVVLLDWQTLTTRELPIGGAGYVHGWTPDSRSLVIRKFGTGLSGVLTIAVASGEPRELSKDDRCQPTLSPDGEWMAATVDRRLAVVDVASLEWMLIADYRGYDCGYFTGWDAPTWSNDSTRIAFVSSGFSAAPPHMARTTTISIANRDGSGAYELTGNAVGWALPKWSPDGQWIAYRAIDGLRLIRPDGTDDHLIFAGAVDRGRVSWTPDSAAIEFGVVSGDDDYGPTALWSYRLDSGVAEALDLGGLVTDFARRP